MVGKNVIVTSFRLSAVGWFTGVLSEIHKAIYGLPIRWGYEISKFECTRARRPLPMGWNTTWDANPLTLAERGFDKVICIVRDKLKIFEACCWYDKQKNLSTVLSEAVATKDYGYVESIIGMYDRLYTTRYVNEKLLYVHIGQLNANTVKGFKEICEFLEFDMKKFPVVIPIKVEKDWEVYGGYNKGLKLDSQLQKMADAKLVDKYFETENTRLETETNKLKIMEKAFDERRNNAK